MKSNNSTFFLFLILFYLLKQLKPLQHYYIQQDLQYATYRKKRLKLTAFGVTLGYIDTIENNTNYKTIITKKQ